jgi:hypothetical protein
MAKKQAVQKVFHVAAEGKDRNAGTERAPFKTLERARDAVRKISGDMTGDIVVKVAPGTHALDHTLVLDHRDSGTNGHNVIYQASGDGPVVVSGGKKITGWKPDTGGRWKARTDLENFRQLYVDGRRVARPSRPAPRGLERVGCYGYSLEKLDPHLAMGQARFPAGEHSMAYWKNIQDVEFCYRTSWSYARCRIAQVTRTVEHDYIHMAQPAFTLANVKEGVQIGYPELIENALELLDRPGEWYLDRQEHRVYYYPMAGEKMNSVEVVAPALEVLVELKGTLDQPVHNIRFEGLTFSYATWQMPSDGFVDIQANFRAGRETKMFPRGQAGLAILHGEMIKSPANVICHAAKAVQFQGCRFTHLGGAGLDLEYGAQNNVVNACEFCDISGSAIQVGDVQRHDHHPDDPRLIIRNNRVTNNRIHDIAVEYHDGLGVFAGYTEGTVIAHNEIYDMPYSAISMGWGWGETDAGGGGYELPESARFNTPTPARNNLIENNHIHHIMKRLLDGGGIYMLGRQPGTVIRGNRIHDSGGIPGGIYLDEGSADIEVTRNVVSGAKTWAIGDAEQRATPIFLNNKAQDRDQTCLIHHNEGKAFIHNSGVIENWKGPGSSRK